MAATQSVKSGLMLCDGVVSEMAAFFALKPGHARSPRSDDV